MSHELPLQLDYLKSALEQARKPLGFFVGAGAPMALKVNGAPLIPGLTDLTTTVRKNIESGLGAKLESLIEHLPKDEQGNLESVLNYVRSLAALPGTGEVRGVAVDDLPLIDAAICGVIRKEVDKRLPEGESPYSDLAVWISAVERQFPTQIFTTNYDLLMEEALETQGVAYFDGFMGSHRPVFDLQAIEEDALPSRWTLLWKLHGSINWVQSANGLVTREPVGGSTTSALIYPSSQKYEQSRRLPYLAMMDRLRAFLKQPGSVLVTTGYSFRDQHINEVIQQSLRANPTASIQGLLHGDLKTHREAAELASRSPNLVLIARDGGVVGTISASWAPDVSADGTETPTTSVLGDFLELGKYLRQMLGDLTRAETAHD